MLKCVNLALGYKEGSEGKLSHCRFCAGFSVCSKILLFVDAHAKLRGMTVSFVTPFSISVFPSISVFVSPRGTTRPPVMRIFMKICVCGVFFENLPRKFKIY